MKEPNSTLTSCPRNGVRNGTMSGQSGQGFGATGAVPGSDILPSDGDVPGRSLHGGLRPL